MPRFRKRHRSDEYDNAWQAYLKLKTPPALGADFAKYEKAIEGATIEDDEPDPMLEKMQQGLTHLQERAEVNRLAAEARQARNHC
jgi:hypothetical protein